MTPSDTFRIGPRFCYTINMRKIFAVLVSAAACGVLCACGEYEYTDVSLPDGFVIRAAIADTPQKTQKGLMFVKELPPDAGMLFVFDKEDEQYFWMKNTLVDLDIIFLDAQQRIRTQYARVPHTYTYTPDAQIPVVSGRARYVLECAAGTIMRHSLKNGDRLEFALQK